ncbi:Avr9/Cf-9 rapidly elicited protein [Melia azedarach]|uniref:Avr9/Cf-9 rapidly elicited protein n=1 Tax=Melia azedarach TaxID=155640 RepID=A0ACC1XLZ4_MELAZ|nr:Avr9/Cf-9 rapidly elicited protein [Melia azedarach]
MENPPQRPKLVKPQIPPIQLQTLPRESSDNNKKQLVWDCGSTLYDSFELNSFKRQLDSAIVSRTLSMPHLPDRRAPSQPVAKKSSSKISRSLQKLLKSIFKSKQSSSSMLKFRGASDEYCVYYDKTGALTTIPEVPEIDFGGLSPEINSLARRTTSERFAAPTIAISCA